MILRYVLIECLPLLIQISWLVINVLWLYFDFLIHSKLTSWSNDYFLGDGYLPYLNLNLKYEFSTSSFICAISWTIVFTCVMHYTMYCTIFCANLKKTHYSYGMIHQRHLIEDVLKVPSSWNKLHLHINYFSFKLLYRHVESECHFITYQATFLCCKQILWSDPLDNEIRNLGTNTLYTWHEEMTL